MRRITTALLLFTLLGAGMCDGGESVVYRNQYVTPPITKDQVTPCVQPDRGDVNLETALLVITDTEERANCNEEKLITVDEILDAFRSRVAEAQTVE